MKRNYISCIYEEICIQTRQGDGEFSTALLDKIARCNIHLPLLECKFQDIVENFE